MICYFEMYVQIPRGDFMTMGIFGHIHATDLERLKETTQILLNEYECYL